MQLFLDLYDAIKVYSERNAFCINGIFYKYSELGKIVSGIRKLIQINIRDTEKIVGLVANDDLFTYASIIALWFEGKAYVPLNMDFPRDRNLEIIEQSQIKTIIDSSDDPAFTEYFLIKSNIRPEAEINLIPKVIDENEIAYILFTSGTTGRPKGVPIKRSNLIGFVAAFWNLKIKIEESDRILQMFELTFDPSVVYLIPLLKGACLYTIPKKKTKYSYIYKLMVEQKLTVCLMVPSILQYLRPYFEEINLPCMKYSIFGGEALMSDITEQWSHCIPNAEILNVYGPTEDTIFCTSYSYNKNASNKSSNGIISIGKAMQGTETIIVNDNNEPVEPGRVGELCLGGVQLTSGYWNNEEKNKESFFSMIHKGKEERFYKTGDNCIVDSEGDILYIGRKDFQVKIQGFRVELSEIEFQARLFLVNLNVMATAITDAIGNTEIGLAIESEESDYYSLLDYMKTKLPVYMIPKRLIFVNPFPLNANGKTDRKKIEQFFMVLQS